MIGGGEKSNNNKNLTQFPSINRGIEIHKTLLLNVRTKEKQRRKEVNPNQGELNQELRFQGIRGKGKSLCTLGYLNL